MKPHPVTPLQYVHLCAPVVVWNEAQRQVRSDAEDDDDAEEAGAVDAHALGGAQELPHNGLVHCVCT